jgi:hypothetical protein
MGCNHIPLHDMRHCNQIYQIMHIEPNKTLHSYIPYFCASWRTPCFFSSSPSCCCVCMPLAQSRLHPRIHNMDTYQYP